MSIREKDDDYDWVIAQLGPKHRVIACKDNIQWIVQQKSGVWRGIHYCTSREGILRRVKGLPGRESLIGLPDRFPRAAGRTERKVGVLAPVPPPSPEMGSVRGAGVP